MSPDDTAPGATPGTGAKPGQADAGTDDKAKGTTPAADDAAMSTDAGREALRKERERADTAERALKALQDKDLPEAERVKRERDELRTTNAGLVAENKRLTTANAVLSKASTLGFADPADAVAFIQASDVDGTDTKAVEAALADLLKRKPYLASAAARPAPGGADLGNKGQPPRAGDMNDALRRAAGMG